jgi:hypothetical protein
MNKAKRTGFLPAAAVTLGVMVAMTPAFAHHSFAAEYDPKMPITLTGVVTKIEWTNPHAHFYLKVTDDGGATVSGILSLAVQTGSCVVAGAGAP